MHRLVEIVAGIEVRENEDRGPAGHFTIRQFGFGHSGIHGGGDPAVTARAYAIASRLKQSEVPQFRDTYGWTRHLHGEHDEALAYIEPLTEALPDNPWIWYHLGEVYAALNRRGEARTALETALEKGGGGFVRAAEINDRLARLASN